MPPRHYSKQRSKDEKQLEKLGYKQEFKRDFSPLQLFGLAFGLLGIVSSFSSVLVYAIPNGGPVSMVWGWLTSSFFLIMIALAIGELGSSMPMCGGLYFWTYRFSSPRCRNLLAWLVGYSDTFSYVAGVAGVDWALAVQIMAAVTIGTNSKFIPTVHQTYGLYCALVVTHCIIGSLTTNFLARLTFVFMAINVLLFLSIVVGVPVATPTELKNSASFALGNFTNFYSWPSGYAFVMSFLAPQWVIGGFDSSVHISEEARNAKIAVPLSVLANTIIGCVLGLALNIAIVFNMGTDLASIMNSPIGQPMATILLNSFGKKGTLVVWSFVIVVQFMVGISISTVCSRLMFAFARDGALPFSKYLYRIDSRSGTPVNCVWASGILAMLLGLLAFVGPLAIGAVFTVAVVAQYISVAVPIAARFLGVQNFEPGPFNLRAFSLPVAVIAVLWMIFMSIVLLFPATPQASPNSMNYSVVVFGGVIILSIIYYYFPKYGGVYWFKGPVSTIEDMNAGNGEIIDSDEKAEGIENRFEYFPES